MTDDEMRQLFAAIDAKLDLMAAATDSRFAAMDAKQDRLMATINGKLDDILDRLSRDREDIDSTRGLVLYALEDSLTLGKRLTKLEDEIRRARRDGAP